MAGDGKAKAAVIMVRTLPVPVLRYFGNPGTHKDDDAGRCDSAIRILLLNSGFIRVFTQDSAPRECILRNGRKIQEMRKTHVRTLPIFALAVAFGVAGCHKNPAQDQSQNAAQVTDDGQDPAMQANLAPASNTAAPAQPQAAQYPAQAPAQQSAPAPETAPPPPPDQTAGTEPSQESGTAPSDQSYDYNAVDQSYQDQAQPVEYAAAPPPPLPEYQQPECPGENYLWTPGYWGYATTGYYWVPGVWVIAPYVGALWTPGYWGFYGGRYGWHHGYWGPHIGFYGGVNYGYGYVGTGYVGGYWRNNAFMYNRSVTVVNTTIVHNVYVHNVTIVNNTRVSYNGGRGGIAVRPLPAENVAYRERHIAPLPEQVNHAREASANKQQWASVNHGRPATLAVARPLPTERRAPAAMPPAVQAQVRQEQVRPVNRPETRPAVQPQRQETPAAAQPRPGQPQQRPETRPAPQPANQPQPRPENRPAPQPQPRPEYKPTPQPQTRPEQQRPESRPAPQPQPRPEYKPAPQPQPRPEQQRPAPQPQQRPQPQQARPESRPAPQPQSRPAPQPKPENRKPE